MMFGFDGRFAFQWPEIFKFRTWNWVNFDFINVNFEYCWFEGKSFELVFIILGLGFYLNWYNQAWHDHAKSLVKNMKLWREDDDYDDS